MFRASPVTYRDHRRWPRGSTGRGQRPREARWAKCGREPAPRWAGAPPTLSPWRNRRGEGGTLAQVGLRPTIRVRHPSSPLGRRTSSHLGLPPLPGEGNPQGGAALPFFLLLSAGAWRSPAGRPRLSIDTTPSCCWSSSPTSPSSLLDQGAGDVTGLHVC